MQRWEPAEERFAALLQAHPGRAVIEASAGALAMDRGRYDEAESLLASAVRAQSASWRTFHRYALLLLHQSSEAAGLRAQKAALYADLALEPSLGDPRVKLTLAQAEMVAERWNASARTLLSLASNPAWRSRAEDEYRELLRRMEQALMDAPRPALTPIETDSALVATAFPRIEPPQPPGPQPLWPPPGAQIVAGKIATVDCYGGAKFVVLKNALFSFRFRDLADSPAKLIFPPMKWKTLPCGTYGWVVNVAYRPRLGDDGARGDLVAILF